MRENVGEEPHLNSRQLTLMNSVLWIYKPDYSADQTSKSIKDK
jgi:hypothetical protein